MPGICGAASLDRDADTAGACGSLRGGLAEHPYRHEARVQRPDPAVCAGALSDTGVIAPAETSAGGVTVLGEGWISGIVGVSPLPAPSAGLHDALRGLYESEGIDFLKRLHGSFCLMVHDGPGGRIHLAADHAASRPVFWAVRDGRLLWAPELSAFLGLPRQRWALSPVATANFLATGFLFADVSWLEGVSCLRPGEYLTWSADGVQRGRHFLYRPGGGAGPDADIGPLADRLGETLLRAVERAYRASGTPLVALSAGWDSRVLLAALAEIGAKDICATTSGAGNTDKYGDGYLAARIARQYGARHSFVVRRHDFSRVAGFTACFGAETDLAAYHLGELTAIDEAVRTSGARAYYRGDECYGYQGRVRNTAEAYAAVMGIRPIGTLRATLEQAFLPAAYAEICSRHRQAIDREAEALAVPDFVDLKDTIFLYHRIARYIQPVNYLKLFHAEVFNPHLDRDILELMHEVPAEHRLFKRVLQEAVRRRLPHALKVRFACRTALGRTERQWRTDPQMRQRILDAFAVENDLWRRLFDAQGLSRYVQAALDAEPWRPSAARRLAARVLMALGVHGRARDRNWKPVRQASPMSVVLRLMILKLWMDRHRDVLRVET